MDGPPAYKRISVDTSKHVFTNHGFDEAERAVLRCELRRSQMEGFCAKRAPTEVALEACGGAPHWGRRLGAMGHRVKLIPPQYVKPFVKRNKNDRHDAEAIGAAASRPSKPTVAVKTVDDQAATMIVMHRELPVGQRTSAINALRGHPAEFGVIAAKGTANTEALLVVLAAEPTIPAAVKAMFAAMGEHVGNPDARLAAMEKQLPRTAQASSGQSAARSDPWARADHRGRPGAVGEPCKFRERPAFRRQAGSDAAKMVHRGQAAFGADQQGRP